MPDTSTIADIRTEVSSNLYDNNLRWFTLDDINNSLQEAYNKLVALLAPIESTSFLPQQASPYYDFKTQIKDYMYLAGIYNPATNLWLDGMSYKLMKSTYQTYLAIGQPKFFNIIDLRRVLIWPFQPSASGVLFVVYKSVAPTINDNHIPILPISVAAQLMEYFTTADLLEQSREFRKAVTWWDKVFKPPLDGERSIFDQARLEIKNLARMDRELVLEPYRWIFHGGALGGSSDDLWISNETPSGPIDNTNPIFTLAQIPNPAASLLLILNEGTQIQGQAYTLSGATITYNSGFQPQVGDVHRAWYQVT